jgi:hypothetical protein
MTYHQIVNKSNTIGATSGAGIAHPSGAPEFIPGLTQLVPLVEQELSILPEHLSLSQVLKRIRFVQFLAYYCVMF